MHTEKRSDWIHDHLFHTGNEVAERSSRWVMWITAITMAVEVAAGWGFNSMALLADGWHMSSHAVAIGLAAFAYAAARRYQHDQRFAFGTWKVEILAAFASAIFLAGVALMMMIGSVERLIAPQPIQFQEAIWVAILGLVVNVACVFILGRAHDHAHSHSHDATHSLSQDRDHAQHHDLNLKSAYVHVLSDAATSVLAIAALVGGWVWGVNWLDPLMGMVGSVWVAVWAKGLIFETSKVLIDREMDHPVVNEIRQVIEDDIHAGHSTITDLHVWRVGQQIYSCAMTVVTHDRTLTPEILRQRISVHEEIVHSTIEIHHCED